MIRIRMLEDSSIVSESRREEHLPCSPAGSVSESADTAPAHLGNIPVSSTQPAGSPQAGIKETVCLPPSEPPMETQRGAGNRIPTPRQAERHVPGPASEIDHRDRISNNPEVAAEPVHSNGMRFRPTRMAVDDAEIVITPGPVLRRNVNRQSGRGILQEYSRLPAFVQYALPGLMFAATLMLVIFPGLQQNRNDASAESKKPSQSQPAVPDDFSETTGDKNVRTLPVIPREAPETQTISDPNVDRTEEPAQPSQGPGDPKTKG